MISQFTLNLSRVTRFTPVAAPAGGGPGPPAPPATPLAGGTPVATVLQPLNVQMAELVGVTKLILAAVVVGSPGGGTRPAGGPAPGPGSGRAAAAFGEAAGALAGAAATATAGFNVLNTAIGKVSGEIASLVGRFSPPAVKQFEFAVADIQASIGESLVPVLRNATAVVRGVADVFASLSGPGRLAVAALVGASVALGTAAVAATAVSVAVNSALGGIPAALSLLVGAGAVAAFALQDVAAVQALVARVAGPVGRAFDALGRALLPLGRAMEPLLDLLADQLSAALDTLAISLALLAPVLEVAADGVRLLLAPLKALTGLRAEGLKAILAALEAAGLVSPSTLKKDASDGKAVRNVTFGSVDEYLRKARASAFSLGTGGDQTDYPKLTADRARDMDLKLGEIRDLLRAGRTAGAALAVPAA